MFRTFKISWRFENTYRTNAIIHSLKSIPIIGKLLPANELYKIGALKGFAGVLSILWEIFSTFLGKFLYTFAIIIVCGIAIEVQNVSGDITFLHMFILLTLAGTLLNNRLFDVDMTSYYAVNSIGLNAKAYALSNYFYWLVRMFVGFIPFTLIFGLALELPIDIALTLPLFVVFAKLTEIALCLLYNEKRESYSTDNLPAKIYVPLVIILLVAALVLPFYRYIIPIKAYYPILAVFGVLSIFSLIKLWRFKKYTAVYRQILSSTIYKIQSSKTAAAQVNVDNNRKLISVDKAITSSKTGFEYLNDLFVKRHRKILWKPILIVTSIAIAIFLGMIAVYIIIPESRAELQGVSIQALPVFPFIMYLINRGTSYTQALFINCDHSMLTFSFYKKPKAILNLFTIRLRELTKLNLLPSVTIAVGLCVLLFVTDGTTMPHYFVLIPIAIIAMSIFFSVHYMTIYYLLQPYTANTEIRGGAFQFVNWLTYVFCFILMQVSDEIGSDPFWFAIIMSIFCVAYCIIACFLVYKYAAKTFKIRT